jgi:HB1/ASXL restriction endonuclease-like protein with HTH domain
MSTLNVVEEVLRERRVPMVVREIVEAAGERLPTKSRTPDTVVARDLSMDIKRRGPESPFIRTSPGKYTLRSLVDAGVVEAATDSVPATGTGLDASDVPVELVSNLPPDIGPESVSQ